MRTIAEVRLSVIRDNYKRLVKGWSGGVPMVKCNAYGHGIVQTARALEALSSVIALGVATLDEAISLREAGVKKPIWVFSECAPFNDELARVLEKFALTPLIHDLDDLKAALKSRHRKLLNAVGIQLKFNTGMNRLGIAVEHAAEARRLLEAANRRAQGLCSHLANSEDPSAAITRTQLRRFGAVVETFSGHAVSYIHCGNTAATLADKKLELSQFCNVIRPGIGMYGYGAKAGELFGLKPALKWKARVVAARELIGGELVGYGTTYKAKGRVAQAVLGAGYGDGLKRLLSNKALLVSSRQRLQKAVVMGRVSMDLTSINIRSKPGEWVTLLGEGRRQGEFMAEQAETVVYEILTSISTRVPRIYL